MKKIYISLFIAFFLFIFLLFLGINYKTTKSYVLLKDSVEVHTITKLSELVNVEGTLDEDIIIDTDSIGDKKISFSYTNKKNKKIKDILTIKVVDSISPIILLNDTYTLDLGFSDNLTDIILSADNYDSNPKREIIGDYDFNQLGSYNLTYRVTDNSGNVTNKDFILTVKEPSSYQDSTSINYSDIVKDYKNDNTRIGIDVSKWQGNIDFDELKSSGVEFVIIRIGTQDGFGNDNVIDSAFVDNINKAKLAGIDVGIYFFSYATTIKEAREQALWVIEQLNDAKIELPIAFDWESWTKFNSLNLSLYDFNQIVTTFLNTILENGYESMVYGSKNYLMNVFSSYENVWLAHYIDKTTYEGNYLLWQRCSNGKVSGISGYVDIDIMYKKVD